MVVKIMIYLMSIEEYMVYIHYCEHKYYRYENNSKSNKYKN